MTTVGTEKLVRCLLFSLVLVVGLPGLATAQTDRPRSDTGRRQPKPPPQPTPEEVTKSGTKATGPSRWFVGLGAGIQGGGDLWHLETVNGAAVPWDSAVPFTTSRFNATLDNNFAMGIFIGRHMGEMWSLRADWSSSRMDVAAEALQGQDAAVFLYDRLTISTLGLATEIRLARVVSYPYLSVGVILNTITAARESELDQSQVGYRLGLGYLKVLTPQFSLRAEARYGRSGFDVGSFVPQSVFASQPEVDYEPADDLNLFEVRLAIQLNL